MWWAQHFGWHRTPAFRMQCGNGSHFACRDRQAQMSGHLFKKRVHSTLPGSSDECARLVDYRLPKALTCINSTRGRLRIVNCTRTWQIWDSSGRAGWTKPFHARPHAIGTQGLDRTARRTRGRRKGGSYAMRCRGRRRQGGNYLNIVRIPSSFSSNPMRDVSPA